MVIVAATHKYKINVKKPMSQEIMPLFHVKYLVAGGKKGNFLLKWKYCYFKISWSLNVRPFLTWCEKLYGIGRVIFLFTFFGVCFWGKLVGVLITVYCYIAVKVLKPSLHFCFPRIPLWNEHFGASGEVQPSLSLSPLPSAETCLSAGREFKLLPFLEPTKCSFSSKLMQIF